jgi:hypothetical protein
MWVTQIFLLFSPQFFLGLPTFWFRGFMLDWDLKRACESCWCLQAVAGHKIWQSFTGCTDDGGYENLVCCNNNKLKCNEEIMLVILNCILLHITIFNKQCMFFKTTFLNKYSYNNPIKYGLGQSPSIILIMQQNTVYNNQHKFFFAFEFIIITTYKFRFS